METKTISSIVEELYNRDAYIRNYGNRQDASISKKLRVMRALRDMVRSVIRLHVIVQMEGGYHRRVYHCSICRHEGSSIEQLMDPKLHDAMCGMAGYLREEQS